MASDSLENIIPKILHNINFEEYLLKNEYSEFSNENIRGFKGFRRTTGSFEWDVIFLGNYKGVEIFYSLLHKDIGNILDFVKNRIEVENIYNTFNPEKDHLIEACKKLVLFIRENGENKIKNELSTSEEDFHDLKKYTFRKYYNLKKLNDTKYLESFSLKKAIINHPIFENTIFNNTGLILQENLDAVNTVFPLHNQSGKECGLYFENHYDRYDKSLDNFSFFAPSSILTGLWLSNNYLLDKKFNTKVTIVTNPKEALAHFAHLKENRFYISIFDQDETTYEHLKSIINRQRSSLYLAANVSIMSFIVEIKIIINILKNEIEFVKEGDDYILLKICKKEEAYFEKFLKLIKKKNILTVNHIIKTLGEDSKEHLKNDLIQPTQDRELNLLVRIPKNFKTLYHFEQILIKTFPSQYDIKIEKPLYLNWIDQNKAFVNNNKNTEKIEDAIQKYIEEKKIFVITN